MKGGVKLMREIKKNDLSLNKQSPQYRNEFNLIRDRISLQIQTLYKGSQFGDYEALHKEAMRSTVVTVIPTLLLSISLNDIKRLQNNDESQMLENNTDKPQTDEEIMEVFLENCYWKRFKNNLVQNVLSDKKINNLNGVMFRKDLGKYSEMDSSYNFLTHKGLYVFSGNGLTFPDVVDHNKKPFEKDMIPKKIGFGTAFSRSGTVKESKSFQISTGKFVSKNICNIKLLTDTKKMLKEEEEKEKNARTPRSKMQARTNQIQPPAKLLPGQKHTAKTLLRKMSTSTSFIGLNNALIISNSNRHLITPALESIKSNQLNLSKSQTLNFNRGKTASKFYKGS